MERRLTAGLAGVDQLIVLAQGVNVVVYAEEGRDGLEARIEAVGSEYEAEAGRAELVPFVNELELGLFPVVPAPAGFRLA